MKKIISIFLSIAFLGCSLLSSGCSIVSKGSEYCFRFLDYILAYDFENAYEMIAESIKAPETAEERAERLKKEEEERANRTSFWKKLFDSGKEEAASDTPVPDIPETPLPNVSDLPEATPTPELQNGRTPDPETGEYPEITESPTPDPAITPEPVLPSEPGSPEIEITPEPTPAPKSRRKTVPENDAEATPTPPPIRDEDGDGIEDPDTTITKVGFVEKYKNIFKELDLIGIEYTVTDITDGEIVALVDYTLTYHSRNAITEDNPGGNLTYDFQIRADRIEHKWVINWSPNLIFPMMEWGDALRVGTLQASRGEILCDGIAYAKNVNTVTVFAVPSSIPDIDVFVAETAAIPELELTEEAVRTALSKQRNDFAKMQTFYPDEMNPDLEERILAIKGMSIDTNNYGTLRYYPFEKSLCHIIGYAGIIDKKEKINYEAYGDIIYNNETKRFERIGDTRYNGDSYIGKYGLELLYEDRLLGTNGRFTYIQDSQGGSRGKLYQTDAIDGNDLHLTIIPELQERLEDVVDTVVYDSSLHGCAMIFNPKTGAIQALTSWPGFDLNYLSRGMPEEEWEALQNDPSIPLYNRATQGLYTPGSIFKPMTCAALIESGTLSVEDVFPPYETVKNDQWLPSETFMSSLEERSDSRPFYDQSYQRALKRTRSDSRPSPMNMINSVISSDNLFFAYCAMKMGWTKYKSYFQNTLKWETPMSLEAQGTRPRLSWKTAADGITWVNVAEGGEDIWTQNEDGTWSVMEHFHPVLDVKINGMDMSKAQLWSHEKHSDEKPLTDYDLAVTGYGQGEIMVSPLQMAYYLSAYANEGKVMQPYVVDSIWHADGTDYTLVEQHYPQVYMQLIQPTTVEMIYPALQQVCEIGTARHMNKSFITKAPLKTGYSFAGKTGTAEITDNKTKELAWFGCWRDKDASGNPVTEENARMIVVMLEIDLTSAPTEWAQMKFDIARAMLKEDVLNNDGI